MPTFHIAGYCLPSRPVRVRGEEVLTVRASFLIFITNGSDTPHVSAILTLLHSANSFSAISTHRRPLSRPHLTCLVPIKTPLVSAGQILNKNHISLCYPWVSVPRLPDLLLKTSLAEAPALELGSVKIASVSALNACRLRRTAKATFFHGQSSLGKFGCPHFGHVQINSPLKLQFGVHVSGSYSALQDSQSEGNQCGLRSSVLDSIAVFLSLLPL